jgi:CRISPR-associated protein Csm1
MSIQVFLQGKLLGIERFLASPATGDPATPATGDDGRLLCGRSRWVTLLSEVLPRALLAELGLAKILLGTSGGGQFLVVLPGEAMADAEMFLSVAAAQVLSLSGGLLQLAWASTENLGDWSVVRKRLSEDMLRKRGAPAACVSMDFFAPFVFSQEPGEIEYFTDEMGSVLQSADAVSWSPENPGKILAGSSGKYTWSLSSALLPDAIPLARHTAMRGDGAMPASLEELAQRAKGRRTWGVLCGDVDNFGIRLRRVHTIEEHVQLSVMYKQFFAGELELLCSMPEYWRKVSILYSGGDDFAIYGSWDSLIPLAREIQRLFHRFTEENLKEFPGPEGKTITMAIYLAADPSVSLASVYQMAGERLEQAKSVAKDSVYVFGRTLEWRQLSAASELRETIERIVAEQESQELFLSELTGIYLKAASAGHSSRVSEGNFDRPWRILRRLNRALSEARDRELQKLRTQLTNEMLTKSVSQVKLRPGGRVALEWAKLLAEV